ncbi:MAG: cupin domain-containing protein [Planctomycetota bacterium]
MKIQHACDVPARSVDIDGAEDVKIRLLIHEQEGAPHFYMRQFTVAPGGYTARHSHAWEHEIYVLAGSGTAFTPEGEKPMTVGQCIYVAPGEEHQFRNTGSVPLEFLCLVPAHAS